MGRSNVSSALAQRIQTTSTQIDQDYDKMFGVSPKIELEQIVELNLNLLKPHPKDPFKPYTEEKLIELATSIEKMGLLDAVIVRPCGNEYEVLSGKNRSNAERLNGHQKIKSIIRDVDDDTAILIITEANLKHRESLKPSEKGFAYRLQMEAITRQGECIDLED